MRTFLCLLLFLVFQADLYGEAYFSIVENLPACREMSVHQPIEDTDQKTESEDIYISKRPVPVSEKHYAKNAFVHIDNRFFVMDEPLRGPWHAYSEHIIGLPPLPIREDACLCCFYISL